MKSRRRPSPAHLSLLLVPALACGGAEDEILDGRDDRFVTDGKSDVGGVANGSPEACAVLKLANLGDLETLDEGVRLYSSTAQAMIAYREGADGELDTADDGWFATLEELDAIYYFGPASFARMRNYAAHQDWQCSDVSAQLLAFNDFHGNLQPPSGSSGRIQTGPNAETDRVDAGGAEYLATHLARLAAANPNTFVVSAGDIIGATPLVSALFHDEPTIESMNLMGLAIASVGNHEFDEGIAELWRMQYGGCHPVDGCADGDGFAGASFSYLAANVVEDATGDTIFPPYTIRRVGGARIAFIGMTLEGTPLVTTAAGVEGLRFADEAETVNALVPVLRAQGIETIVVLLHEGGRATGLYNECAGISGAVFEINSALDAEVDVLVTGHTNAAHVCNLNGRVVTSAAHAGRLISDIDLVIDELTGDVKSATAANVIVTRDVEKNAAQTALINKYLALAAPLANRVIGRITADIARIANPAGESALGDVIADSQLEGTRSAGAVAAFMNPGGIRTDLLSAQISGGEAAGEITYGEIFAVQPFGNNLITMDVTGAQLDTMLEQQWSLVGGVEKANMLAISASVSYAWSGSAALGSRIELASIKLDGQAIDPNATYRITVNSFLADGGDGFAILKQGSNRVAGPLDLTPLEAYLAARSPLSPPALGRVTKLP